MAESFDPYYIWLGIPPEEQPPHHYRLLAINLYESNPDVIESAADRQMAHLRTFQSGKHAALSQRLLNKCATAKIVLLDQQKKAEYDQELRARSAAAAPAIATPLPTAAPLVAERMPAAAPMGQASPTDGDGQWDVLLGAPTTAGSQIGRSAIGKSGVGKSAIGKSGIGKSAIGKSGIGKGANGNGANGAAVATAVNSPSPAPSARAKKLPPWVFAAPVAAILLSLGICVYVRNNQPDAPPDKDAAILFAWPPNECHAVKTITVDGEAVPAMTGDAWEFPCTAGSHHIVAKRTGYKDIDTTLTTQSGVKLPLSTPWQPKAVISLNWPNSDRAGSTLLLDNRPQTSGDKQPLQIAVEPGDHQVAVHRSKGPPVQMHVTVAADENRTVDIPLPAPPEGKLLVVWPLGDRFGGELRVDGELKPLMPQDPIVLSVPAGEHRLWCSRPGFRPVERTIWVGPAGNQAVTVNWIPVPPVHNVVDNQPDNATGPASNHKPPDKKPVVKAPDKTKPPVTANPDTAKPVEVVKAPVPSAADQEKVAKQVDQLYKTTHSNNPDDDVNNIKQLYEVAGNSKDAPTDRYVLLVKGIELAEDAGEAALAMDGIDSLDAAYVIDAADMRQKAIDRLSKSATREDSIVAVVTLAEKMADDAIADDKYDQATNLLNCGSRAAQKKAAGVDYRKEVEKRFNIRRNDIKAAQAMFAAVERAKTALQSDPDDSTANSTVGRWLCFHKLQWEQGLPYLLKSKDDKLKAAAQKETPPPTDAVKQADLADAWVDIITTQPPAFRDAISAHATDWYEKALPNLPAGLAKMKAEKRMKELADAHSSDKPGKVAAGAKSVTNAIGMRLALIQPGEFMMGSPPNEVGHVATEVQHKVKITKPFYMGVFPVTQAEYFAVVGSNPSYFSTVNFHKDTSRFPVEQVTFDDAEGFCRLLSNLPKEKGAGRKYRLPTEAEWEYACRAGTTTPYFFGQTIALQNANFRGGNGGAVGSLSYDPNAVHSTMPVGSYRPNNWGLCDMCGNVFQMCSDWYGGAYSSEPAEDPQGPANGSTHVMRGGGFSSPAAACRSASRSTNFLGNEYDYVGFRVVCETAATLGAAAKDTHVAKP